MTWFTSLRFFVLARRGIRALEDIQVSARILAARAQDTWDREIAKDAPKFKRKVEFGAFDQEAVNERYRKEREANIITEGESEL